VHNDWDIQNLTNWLNNAALDFFINGDSVTFDAAGTANSNVNLTASVQPASVRVDAAADYTLSGAGTLSGAMALTKTNTGKLTVQNNHIFTGGVSVKGGTLSVATLADVSNPSPLGQSGTILLDGGTLEYTGANTTWTRDLTLGSSGAGLSVPGATETLTLSGQLGGAGALTKVGNGTLTLSGAVNSFAGGALVNAGTLRLTAASGAGSGTVTLNGGILSVGAVEPVNNIDVQVPSVIRGGDSGGLSGIRVLTGDSDLTVEITVGVFDFIASMGTYSNTITLSNAGGASARFDGTTGSSLATFDLGVGIMDLMIRNSLQNVNIGALKGGPDTTLSGRGGSSNNGPTTHHIGANGQSTTFNGIIRNGSGGGSSTTSIVKTGPGTLTLTKGSTYTGTTTISNGVLALSYNGVTDGDIGASSSINLLAGAALDVSGRSDGTLQLGGSQTLSGNGTIRGSLNASGAISPGASIGTLTVTNVVTLAGNAFMELNTTNGIQTNDVLVGQAGITLGGSLTVSNAGPTLMAGQRFVLFSGPVTGTFGAVNLPTGELNGTTYTWTDNLSTDGSITVASVVPPVDTTPTNVTATVSGSDLTLSWPTSHIGWTLQVQTNARSVGLTVATNTWFDVAGSAATNSVTIPTSKSDPTVFYRLRLPQP
jgi:autotransporter-associated beta strand protein